MIARILAVAGPMFVYAALAILAIGIWRERKKLDWAALVPALAGLAASFAFLPAVHRLFFDEDIYVNIASNLTRAPVAQITIFGGPDGPEVSSYYKEPPGWPVVLSLAFLLAGRTETVAFIAARIMFAIAIAVVYQLARASLQTRKQAVLAAILFGAAPVSFWFSPSAGTDLPAVVFAALGMWGCLAGNGPLAAAGLALAAQTRLELIAITPLVWLAGKVPLKWKWGVLALVIAEVAHIGWVMSITPDLAEAEKVSAAFSAEYAPQNLVENLRYMVSPFRFPAAMAIAAALAVVLSIWKKTREGRGGSTEATMLLALQAAALSGIYLLFYAGSFDMNPRYSIQLLAPMAVLAASVVKRPALAGVMILSMIAPHIGRDESLALPRAHRIDHELSVQFASGLGSNDLVVSPEPEAFLNQGVKAMNAVFVSELKDELEAQLRSGGKAWYHVGVRTNDTDSREGRADRWVKSNFELHLIDSHEINGMTVAFYEILL